jgi:hypothetical protein
MDGWLLINLQNPIAKLWENIVFFWILALSNTLIKDI